MTCRSVLWRRATGAMVIAAAAPAHEGKEHGAPEVRAIDTTDIWTLARGGQLYDNWWAVVEADPPQSTHPAYPSTGYPNANPCQPAH